MVSAPKRSVGFYEESSPVSTASPNTKVSCCFPMFRSKNKRRSAKGKVKFSAASDNFKTLGKSRSMRSNRTGRSPGKNTFYTAYSQLSQSDVHDLNTTPSVTDGVGCPCGFPAHATFNPETPLVIPPGVEPGSRLELEIHAKAMLGRWITVVSRSESLDAQMQYVGIGRVKRMIMNKLVIPLGAEIIDNGETLKVWIETPTGNKATHASLVGKETFDADSDLGDWTATTYITDYSYAGFCEGREVRALQMERSNPKLGKAYETKVVLPDAEFGKILLYSITIVPANGADRMHVNRVYKPV